MTRLGEVLARRRPPRRRDVECPNRTPAIGTAMAPVSMKFPTAKLRRGSPDAYPRPVAARKIEDYYVFPMGSGFCAVGQSRTPTAMVAANWRSCDVAWALLRPAQAQRPRPPTSR